MKLINKHRFEKLPSAVLMDIDDTLYSYASAHKKALSAVRVLVSSEFAVAEESFDKFYEAAREDVKAKLNGAPSARNRLLYFQRMFELLGVGSSVLKSLNCEQTYWNMLLSEAELFDGLTSFLDEVRLNGITLIAVSNLTSQIQFRKLVYFNLHDAFDFIVTSEQVGFEKPDKRIFETALSHINCSGEDVWMIGDDLQCDIEGAKSAINATTLLKCTGNGAHYSTSDAIDARFSHFDKLTLMLQRINGDLV
jgi:putative hydrolase of the HAD superfamily